MQCAHLRSARAAGRGGERSKRGSNERYSSSQESSRGGSTVSGLPAHVDHEIALRVDHIVGVRIYLATWAGASQCGRGPCSRNQRQAPTQPCGWACMCEWACMHECRHQSAAGRKYGRIVMITQCTTRAAATAAPAHPPWLSMRCRSSGTEAGLWSRVSVMARPSRHRI